MGWDVECAGEAHAEAKRTRSRVARTRSIKGKEPTENGRLPAGATGRLQERWGRSAYKNIVSHSPSRVARPFKHIET